MCVVLVELPRVWNVLAVVGEVNPSLSQPLTNDVLMFAVFFEPSTLLLLNVMMFTSQQIELVSVGGGGENVTGDHVVFSSRSKMFSVMSSHEPAVLLKFRWKSFGALPVPAFT